MPQAREVPAHIVPGINSTGSQIPGQRIVKKNTAAGVDQVQLAAAATDVLHGVAMADIENGVSGDIQKLGLARVEAGAAVAIGARITSDAVGRGVTAVSTNTWIGVANTAAAALGDIIEVELVGEALPPLA